MPIYVTKKYADPEMHHVGAFQSKDGMHSVAQKGAVFYHFTEVPHTPGPLDPPSKTRSTRQARIYRDGEVVSYEIDFGAPPASADMSKVVSMLPNDMRNKKVVVRKPDPRKI